jgi:hypothetical protein
MKRRNGLIGLPAIGVGLCLMFGLTGCPIDLGGPGTQGTTGSISGFARFSGQTSNAGITITAESTDGVRTAFV